MKLVSRESVLAKAVELAAEYGESLTLTAFRRETGYSQHVIFDLFGNWCELRVAVGLTPEAPRARNKISREKILKLACEQAELYGEKLTEQKFLNATGLSGRMIADRFGSWGALRELVGLKRRAVVSSIYEDEDLLMDMYRVYRRCREEPAFNRHRFRGGKISPHTISTRFGSWHGAKCYFKQFLRDHGHDGEDGWSLPKELEEKILASDSP